MEECARKLRESARSSHAVAIEKGRVECKCRKDTLHINLINGAREHMTHARPHSEKKDSNPSARLL